MKPFIVVAGHPGAGKTYEVLKSFRNSLYVATQQGNPHFYMTQWAKGRLKDTPPGRSPFTLPKAMRLIEAHGTGKWDFAKSEWIMTAPPIDEKGNSGVVLQRTAIETTLFSVLQQTKRAVAEGKKPPFASVVVDEVGEIWQRVHDEKLPDFGVDTRSAFLDTTLWHQRTMMPMLRALPAYGVGVALIAHETEADAKRRGGAKMPSKGIATHLAAQCDGLVRRKFHNVHIENPDPNSRRTRRVRRWWDTIIDEDSDCKLRGVADEEAWEVEDMELDELLEYAGFDMGYVVE